MDTVVTVKKTKSLPGQIPMKPASPFDRCYGFYGMVTEVHPETLTVNVLMDTGRKISGVRVASRQWVTMDEEKDYLTGERNLPPVNSFVLCLMPTGEPTSAVVLCSVFAYQDSMGGGISEFKPSLEDTEAIDEAKAIEKTVDNGGWLFTHDKRTGSRRIQNAPKIGDETISLEIDQENKGNEKVKITIHGNIYTIDRDNGIKEETDKNHKSIIQKNKTVEIGGNDNLEIKGNATWEIGGNLNINTKGSVKINGATIDLN